MKSEYIQSKFIDSLDSSVEKIDGGSISKKKGDFKCGSCEKKYKCYSSFYTHFQGKHQKIFPIRSTFNGIVFNPPSTLKGRPPKSQKKILEKPLIEIQRLNEQQSQSYGYIEVPFQDNEVLLSQFSFKKLDLIYQSLPQMNKGTKRQLRRKTRKANSKFRNLTDKELRLNIMNETNSKLELQANQQKGQFFNQFWKSFELMANQVQKYDLKPLADPKKIFQSTQGKKPNFHQKICQAKNFQIDSSKIQDLQNFTQMFMCQIMSEFKKFDSYSEKLKKRISFQMTSLLWLFQIVRPMALGQLSYLLISLLFQQSHLEQKSTINIFQCLDQRSPMLDRQINSFTITSQNLQERFNQNIKILVEGQCLLKEMNKAFRAKYCQLRYQYFLKLDLW